MHKFHRMVFFISVSLAASCAASGKKKSASSPPPEPTPTPPAVVAPLQQTNARLRPLDEATLKSIRIENFGQVDPGVFRGARPTKDGMTDLQKIGVKTVVSLEEYTFAASAKKAEEDFYRSANIKFVHVPMGTVTTPKKDDIRRALDTIADPNSQPVYVHCKDGSKQTGVVIGAYRMQYNGWTYEQAVEEMKRYGKSIWLDWWNSGLKAFQPATP